jgi:hypothetical protein
MTWKKVKAGRRLTQASVLPANQSLWAPTKRPITYIQQEMSRRQTGRPDTVPQQILLLGCAYLYCTVCTCTAVELPAAALLSVLQYVQC